MLTLGITGASLFLALLLRILPHQLAPEGLGVDHWFWKTYIETYQRERQFPPKLPQYLLDEQQWYPPLFPMLISRLPSALFDRYNYLFAALIDLVRMILLLCFTGLMTDGNQWALGAAALSYATTPILISYNIQLNPRGLGALLLDILILMTIWMLYMDGSIWLSLPILLLSGLILLTHKMTAQLLWFLCLGTGSLLNGWFFVLIPASVAMAMILSRGFYWNVLRSHWDIVTFWHRNWRWLQVHPIKESPVYGEPGYETPTKMYRKGLIGIFRHLSYLFGYNPTVWLICLVVGGQMIPLDTNVAIWILGWVILIVFFALLTVFIPFIRCLGSGYLYLYNAAFPTALLWGYTISSRGMNIILWIFATAITLSFVSIGIFYWKLRASDTQKIDNYFDKVLNYLKTAPKGAVVCFPQQSYDVIAYKTGQPVLYGGHGFGFKLLEPIFPRLLLPIKEIIKLYKVRYIITLKGYLPANFLSDFSCKSVLDFGEYRVYDLISN
jgi:hypothetical protein